MSDPQPIIHSALTSTTSLAAAAVAAAAAAPAADGGGGGLVNPTPPSHASYSMVEAGNLALMVIFGLRLLAATFT